MLFPPRLMEIAGAVAWPLAIRSADGEGEMPAGEPTDCGKMKSSMFIDSDGVPASGALPPSIDFRSWAMPLGAGLLGAGVLDIASLDHAMVSERLRAHNVAPSSGGAIKAEPGATHPLRSISILLRFIAIIRHVKFSMRSALGNWDLALLYSFHTCDIRGSCRCISSGLARAGLAASSFHIGTNESCSTPLRAAASEGERSSLLSTVVAEVSEGTVEAVAEEVSSMV